MRRIAVKVVVRWPRGNVAREAAQGKAVVLCTKKAKRSDAESTGSFGRYLIEVYAGGESVNEWLLKTGRAVPFMD